MSKKEKKEKPEADVDAKPEGAEGAEGEEAPKKGKKKLLIIAAVGLLVVIGAGLFFSGVLGGKKAPAEGGEHTEAAAPAEPKLDEHGKPIPVVDPNKPIYYELPQFLVNLNSSTSRVSFLKMSVTLELKDQASVVTVENNKPRIIDTFNTYLRELRASDVQGSAGIYRLRDELMARLNATIEEGLVKDILFSEIIVQ